MTVSEAIRSKQVAEQPFSVCVKGAPRKGMPSGRSFTRPCIRQRPYGHGTFDLASWAAMPYTHCLMIGSMPKDKAIARTRQTLVELQRAIDVHPTMATAPQPHDPSCLDERF